MTVNDVLKIAAADIGYTESPPNSNKTKYGEWYGMNGQPWCMMAVQYWFDQAGSPLPYKTASCSALERWYRSNKPGSVYTTPAPGDVVIYNFGHTGIVESVSGSKITAIEGNTSAGSSGSQNNGGGVYRRTRSISLATAFLRPDYSDEEDIDNMTDEQFYDKVVAAIKKYNKSLRTNNCGTWSEKSRNWAVNTGLIEGGDPLPNGEPNYMWPADITREQFVEVLYRLAQMIADGMANGLGIEK